MIHPVRFAHGVENVYGKSKSVMYIKQKAAEATFDMERITGLEPATSTLARSRSTK